MEYESTVKCLKAEYRREKRFEKKGAKRNEGKTGTNTHTKQRKENGKKDRGFNPKGRIRRQIMSRLLAKHAWLYSDLLKL